MNGDDDNNNDGYTYMNECMNEQNGKKANKKIYEMFMIIQIYGEE